MREPEAITARMIRTFSALNEQVTYFGDDGIVRNIFQSISQALADQELELARVKRASSLVTASGDDLDTLAVEIYGTSRRGPAKSTALVIVQGPTGVQVPAGTAFYHATTGEKYVSKNGITIGSTNPAVPGSPNPNELYFPGLGNPSLEGADGSISFGHWVWVESEGTGSKTRASANTITVTPNAALTVFNPAPTTGGEDTESDSELRSRLIGMNLLRATYTNSFFENIAIEANDTIQKALVQWTYGVGISVFVCNRSGCLYTANELTAINDYIVSKIPAFFQASQNTVSFACSTQNVTYTDIAVEFRGKFTPSPTLMDTYIAIIDRMADLYINPGRLTFGQPVYDDSVVKAIQETGLALDLQLNSVLLNGSSRVDPAFNSICRIGSVKLIDDLTSQTINLSLISASNP
ncbi:MAG: hypothetical protein HUU10_04550 [Bacteroidetes bacterium]|nr:hypothetical protein [Bacteroidota bacterium]